MGNCLATFQTTATHEASDGFVVIQLAAQASVPRREPALQLDAEQRCAQVDPKPRPGMRPKRRAEAPRRVDGHAPIASPIKARLENAEPTAACNGEAGCSNSTTFRQADSMKTPSSAPSMA
jgi:hypothetical protein